MSEGKRCNPLDSHNECGSGLVCTGQGSSPAVPFCPENYCCPVDSNGAINGTNAFCQPGCAGGAASICKANADPGACALAGGASLQAAMAMGDDAGAAAGALRVRNKEWQPLEEGIGVALNRLDEQLDDRPVHVDVPSQASLVPFDAILVEQLFINLVENAVKYTPASSPIFIAARRIARGVEVTVADSGPGVPAGQEESIFEKFHRAARSGPGMGIGLTICRGIVMAHGGKIWCERAEGGGASFRFVLPLDEAGPPRTVLPEAVGDP